MTSQPPQRRDIYWWATISQVLQLPLSIIALVIAGITLVAQLQPDLISKLIDLQTLKRWGTIIMFLFWCFTLAWSFINSKARQAGRYPWAALIATGVFFLLLGTQIPAPIDGSLPIVTSKIIPIDTTAKYFARLYNCDDACQMLVEGREAPIIEVTYAEDSGWVDITDFLSAKETKTKVLVRNAFPGETSYGIQIKKNDDPNLIDSKQCGLIDSFRCNERVYQGGIIFEFSYTFVEP